MADIQQQIADGARPNPDLLNEQQCTREDTHDAHAWSGARYGKRWCTGYVGRAGVEVSQPQPPKRMQLAVLFNDHTTMYYPVDHTRGWRIDAPSRCLIIGRGIPRTHIPFDQVRSFEIEEIASEVRGG